jgi:hypothetical protein
MLLVWFMGLVMGMGLDLAPAIGIGMGWVSYVDSRGWEGE